jgi:hypothetical protein
MPNDENNATWHADFDMDGLIDELVLDEVQSTKGMLYEAL